MPSGSPLLGTPSADTEFSPLINDNLVYPNGFSNCVTADENPQQIGIGLLGAASSNPTLNGFSWIDTSNDGVRDPNETPNSGLEIIAYRCNAPWGIVGRATTDDDGAFEIADVLPGDYQFGVMANDELFAPLGPDNDAYPNGFTNCISLGETSEQVGIGVLEGG